MDERFNIIYIINTIMTLTLTKFKINPFLEKKRKKIVFISTFNTFIITLFTIIKKIKYKFIKNIFFFYLQLN